VPLIVAFDEPVEAELAARLCGIVDGIKVGLPAVIRGGLEWAREVSRAAGSCEGLRILDLKLADIGHVMRLSVEPFIGYYDGFIAHSFVGGEGSLDELKSYLDHHGARLVLVASMSHPGSRDVYDRALDFIMEVIERVDPWGIVAPATRPSIIGRLRARFASKKILSPGVGAQGARPGYALRAGADYEIVGRAITGASDPLAAAKSIIEAQEEVVRGGVEEDG